MWQTLHKEAEEDVTMTCFYKSGKCEHETVSQVFSSLNVHKLFSLISQSNEGFSATYSVVTVESQASQHALVKKPISKELREKG